MVDKIKSWRGDLVMELGRDAALKKYVYVTGEELAGRCFDVADIKALLGLEEPSPTAAAPDLDEQVPSVADKGMPKVIDSEHKGAVASLFECDRLYVEVRRNPAGPCTNGWIFPIEAMRELVGVPEPSPAFAAPDLDALEDQKLELRSQVEHLVEANGKLTARLKSGGRRLEEGWHRERVAQRTAEQLREELTACQAASDRHRERAENEAEVALQLGSHCDELMGQLDRARNTGACGAKATLKAIASMASDRLALMEQAPGLSTGGAIRRTGNFSCQGTGDLVFHAEEESVVFPRESVRQLLAVEGKRTFYHVGFLTIGDREGWNLACVGGRYGMFRGENCVDAPPLTRGELCELMGFE